MKIFVTWKLNLRVDASVQCGKHINQIYRDVYIISAGPLAAQRLMFCTVKPEDCHKATTGPLSKMLNLQFLNYMLHIFMSAKAVNLYSLFGMNE